MVVRRWLQVFGTASGTALILGAGQLGLAYGLGVLRWDQPYGTGSGNLWNAQLTWVAWIAEVTVVLAAAGGLRRAREPGGAGLISRLISVCAATAGGVITLPLVTVPARIARPPLPVNPALVAALTAGAGLLVGLIVAFAVVSIPPVAGDAVSMIVVAWLLTVATVAIGARAATPRLGMLDLSGRGVAQPWEIPVLAGILGLIVAVIARWAGSRRLPVAAAGAGGPVLLAAAYLIAGYGVAPELADQLNPYRMSLIGLAVGVAMSVAVAVLPAPRAPRPPSVPTSRPSVPVPEPGGPPPRPAGPPQSRPGAPQPPPGAANGPATAAQEGQPSAGRHQSPPTPPAAGARHQPGPAPAPSPRGRHQPAPPPPPSRSQRSPGQPARDQPARDQPARDQPARDQPARDQPARDQPARDQPARDQPTPPEWPPQPAVAPADPHEPRDTLDLSRPDRPEARRSRPRSWRHQPAAEPPSDPHLDWVRDLGSGS